MSFWQKYLAISSLGLFFAWGLRSFVVQSYRVEKEVEFLGLNQGDWVLGIKIFSLRDQQTQDLDQGEIYLAQTRGSPLIWPTRVLAADESKAELLLEVDQEGSLKSGDHIVLAKKLQELAGKTLVLKKGEVFVYPLPDSAPQAELADFVFLDDEVVAKLIWVLFRREKSEGFTN
jgi:hypothetical protein